MTADTYTNHTPCKTCNTTTRYVTTNQCMQCTYDRAAMAKKMRTENLHDIPTKMLGVDYENEKTGIYEKHQC